MGIGEKGRKRRLAPHSLGLLDKAVQENVGRVSIKVFNALIRPCVTLCVSWRDNSLSRRSRNRIERHSGKIWALLRNDQSILLYGRNCAKDAVSFSYAGEYTKPDVTPNVLCTSSLTTIDDGIPTVEQTS